jgi:hypothetical protein
VYLGPEAPPGRETNWTPTKPGERFFLLFRWYGPLRPVFDRSWVLNDVERLE